MVIRYCQSSIHMKNQVVTSSTVWRCRVSVTRIQLAGPVVLVNVGVEAWRKASEFANRKLPQGENIFAVCEAFRTSENEQLLFDFTCWYFSHVNFRSKFGLFLSDFCQLSTSSWCLIKSSRFNLKSPWSLEKDAKSLLLKSSSHIAFPQDVFPLTAN